MPRTLATIQRITSIESIEGADKIEIAHLLGWQCVTQKSNNFKPGDLVCYFEIDSMLPLDTEEFSFLRKNPAETHGRIKTIKLKGKFSQGLLLPIEIIRSVLKTADEQFEEGQDLTERLKIKKYEPPQTTNLGGENLGDFPQFVSKTDETRIQAYPDVLTRHKGERMYVTEKIDGSSVTVFYVPRNTPGIPTKCLELNPYVDMIFGVCSRNLVLKESLDNSFWKAVTDVNLRQKLTALNKPIVLQGELFGAGVQGNKLKAPKTSIVWFNVVDPMTRRYYGYEASQDLLTALGLTRVPVLTDNLILDHTVEDLVQYSIGKSALNPEVWREGIVLRSYEPKEDRELGNLSFKVINPEFSVKYGE